MKKPLAMTLVALLVASTTCGSTMKITKASIKNTLYTYTYKKGDYQETAARDKDYSGSYTPYGYAYAICGNGNPSSVQLRKRKKDTSSYVKCSEFVTIPYYTHTNIRNDFNKSKDVTVKLRVRDNTNHGSTGGYWSSDSSKKYKHVVG